MNSITITVPLNDREALLDAAQKFRILAGESIEITANIKTPDKSTGYKVPAPGSQESLPLTPENVDAVCKKIAETVSNDVQDDKPSAPEGVQLDGNGFPWDARIHSSSKRITKKGFWQYRKNLTATEIKKVEDELKALMAIPSAETTTAPAPPTAPTPPAPPAPETTTASAPPTAPTPPAPPAPVTIIKYRYQDGEYTAEELFSNNWTQEQIDTLEKVEVEIKKSEPETGLTFPQLLAKLTKAVSDNLLTTEAIDAAISKVSGGVISSKPMLAAKPDLIPAVDRELFPNG